MMALICGITPLASVLRRKISAYPASEATPSWMRAPPESFNPIMGAPLRMARSIIFTIFCALDSESEPPKTVKSCAKTYTRRPSMRPKPVTKPSPAGRCSSEPKSTQRWRTNLSSSSKEPSSSRCSMRSRAESFPALCSRSRRSGPPPASASAEMRRNWSMRSALATDSHVLRFFSAKRPSLGRFILWSEDQHGDVRGQPDGAEEQHNAEQNFRDDGAGARQRRFDGSDIQRGTHQDGHGAERGGHDHQNGQDGEEYPFHGRQKSQGS